MTDTRKEVLEQELVLADLLANVFLTLPTEESVEATLRLDPADLSGTESGDALAVFIKANRERDLQEVLMDVARDRSALVRGAGTVPVEPPYESLYAEVDRVGMIGSLNRFYNEAGLHKVEDVHDSPDQIGVEFAFLSTILRRELAHLEADEEAEAAEAEALAERFCSEHLHRWSALYAAKLIEFAKTDYWRAIGYIILDAKALRA